MYEEIPFYTLSPVGSNPSDADPRAGCIGSFIGAILAIALCALLSLLAGCTTPKVVTVERVTHDTLRITQRERDSIFMGSVERDSVALTQRGDTIAIVRWHTRTVTQYRDRWHHDSIYITRRDSIPVPVPVTKEVPAELTRWQRARLHLANAMLVALAAAAAVWLLKKRTWWLTSLRKIL